MAAVPLPVLLLVVRGMRNRSIRQQQHSFLAAARLQQQLLHGSQSALEMQPCACSSSSSICTLLAPIMQEQPALQQQQRGLAVHCCHLVLIK
jgi:hypothetical protein